MEARVAVRWVVAALAFLVVVAVVLLNHVYQHMSRKKGARISSIVLVAPLFATIAGLVAPVNGGLLIVVAVLVLDPGTRALWTGVRRQLGIKGP